MKLIVLMVLSMCVFSQDAPVNKEVSLCEVKRMDEMPDGSSGLAALQCVGGYLKMSYFADKIMRHTGGVALVVGGYELGLQTGLQLAESSDSVKVPGNSYKVCWYIPSDTNVINCSPAMRFKKALSVKSLIDKSWIQEVK